MKTITMIGMGLALLALGSTARAQEPVQAGELDISGEGKVDATGAEGEMPGGGGEEPSSADTSSAGGSLLEVSLKAGGHFPTNDLSTNFDAILKVGLGVAAERRLQVFAELGYTQPTNDVKKLDPRLGGAAGQDFQSKLTVRDLSTSVGVAYFFKDMSSLWLPYAGAALHFHFLKSEVEASSAMQSFGNYDETSTQVGGVAFGGVGFHLGPGMLLGELRLGYAPVGQKVTGDANVGALSILLGYGLLLL